MADRTFSAPVGIMPDRTLFGIMPDRTLSTPVITPDRTLSASVGIMPDRTAYWHCHSAQFFFFVCSCWH